MPSRYPTHVSDAQNFAMETVSLSDFSEHLQHPFPVTVGGTTLNLVLTEAKPTIGGLPRGREPFSLTFRGPAQPLLPQAMYDFQHPRHGVLAIFIVPIDADAQGTTYEAVFS